MITIVKSVLLINTISNKNDLLEDSLIPFTLASTVYIPKLLPYFTEI
ncbi:hypothetical protein EMUCRT_0281 [Ehrlichia cf. muris str. EmCRT]|uniref:Uncharacterized protein n=1 Tax=Ehrlichia cf. muris str. EmCRT TaxID=1359167 RepID=A0A0F3NB77_9RICK|nr:hypothetical protein EMUCRT_0281 [Ehrlichia cf. muris str. EmCRT]